MEIRDRRIYFVIVAGGTGSRYGGNLPKQYCLLGGKPVLCHTIERARAALPNADIVTVVSHEMKNFWTSMSAEYGCEPTKIVEGGSTRAESVKNALAAIDDCGEEAVVLIHDAARPLLDRKTAESIVDAIADETSVVPVMTVTDSLRFINEEGVSIPVDRERFRAVATPQGFRLRDLKQAYDRELEATFTDDASVMAAAGMTETILIEAPAALSKITSPGDIARLETLL